jgi:hypothetical protein
MWRPNRETNPTSWSSGVTISATTKAYFDKSWSMGDFEKIK